MHNVYLLTAFEEWSNNSLTHSDVSFENFQYLCIRPPVDISTVDFKILEITLNHVFKQINKMLHYW